MAGDRRRVVDGYAHAGAQMTALYLVPKCASPVEKPAAMKLIAVKLPEAQVELLIQLASEQLFRREFVDSKRPGHKPKPEEVKMGKEVIRRLRMLLDRGCLKRSTLRYSDAL